MQHRLLPSITRALAVSLFLAGAATASPHFSRQYEISCAVCHSAGPKLNRTGEAFIHRGLWLPGWESLTTVDTRDPDLLLPHTPPLSVRAQGYARVRRGNNIDPQTSATTTANYDIQSPYRLDLIGGTALTEHTSFEFDAAFADRAGASRQTVDRAVLRYTGLLGSLVIGQFPLSDLMFSRRQRLTIQDYLVYSLAGMDNERAVLLNVDLFYGGLMLGAANGNGSADGADLNSPGLGRSDRLFDNNNDKDYFARIALDTDYLYGGLYMLMGNRDNAAASQRITRTISGVDGAIKIANQFYLYGQALLVRWDDFLQANVAETWYGGYIGIDYVTNANSSFSLLYNYINAGTLATSATIYRGLSANTITASVSHYFARNVRGIIEINTDFLAVSGSQYGHVTKEDYFLTGLDFTF